jgi:trans-2,3-dihydro-3-hydroxyanthranilate isomerase
MKRRLYQLDVFTRRPFRGNPLAVITDADGLRPAQMQAVAREMNLSETVFVQKPITNSALARLRIFSMASELPLAGHPVIGAWFLLAELGVVPAREGAVHVQQQTGAGVLPVEIFFQNGRPRLVTMTQRPAQFRPARLARKQLAAMLGLRPADIDSRLPAEFVSTGISNLMVPLASRSALARIAPNFALLRKALGRESFMGYCFISGGHQIRARGMMPGTHIEDPGTGSAAGSLAAYLVRHGRAERGQPLQILQGAEMGRPSQIFVSVLQMNAQLTPKVSGSAVRVFEGYLEA